MNERQLHSSESLQNRFLQFKIDKHSNMLGDNLDINVLKYGVICIVSLLAFIVVFIFKLIFGSYIIGILIFVVLLWIMIFKIGITIMYPGSSNYFTSQIQIRIGNELAKNLHHLGHCFQFVAECIIQRKVEFTTSQWNLRQKVLGNIHSSIQMLSMFQNNLSARKAKMLQIFRHLIEQLQARHSLSSIPLSQASTQPLKSISQFLQHPKKIRMSQGQQHQFLCQRVKNILSLSQSLQQIILTYKPPEKTFQFIKYKFFQEKLYEVRFGYQRWNYLFEYEVHLIKNYGNVLECAVIKRSRANDSNQQHQQQPNGKYILFCNPNGVYIQLFAVQNTYIHEYLRQGYQVILWNYRGYGQSTGSPTINKSQSDAAKVYNYFTDKGMKIQVVHGYSIGGCAAIGLVAKLQENQKLALKNGGQRLAALRNQNLPNNVKILIVDRSFSSIADMAIQLGSTLHRLAKIVFSLQNTNLSQQFVQLKVQKLLLWDKSDEVIPESASVKGGILMGVLGKQEENPCKNCSNCMNNQQQNALNQEVSVLINQRDSQEQFLQINRKFLKRFTNSLKVLLNNSCAIQKTGSIELNANHQYDPTVCGMRQDYEQNNNENIELTEQIVNQILSTLQSVDGGGSFLPHPIGQFRKLMKTNPASFQYKCQSYILGLVHYGSILPVQVGFQAKTQIQAQTIKKVDNLIKNLNIISDQSSQTTKILEPQLSLALQNIKKTFVEVKSTIQTKFLLPQNSKFGKIVALNSGHNGSLPNDQLRMLMKYIRQACAVDQHLDVELGPMSEVLQQQQGQINSNVQYNQDSNRLIQPNSTDNMSNSETHNAFLQ